MPLTPCLRCPRCGSSLGPGCDCFIRDKEPDHRTKIFQRDLTFEESKLSFDGMGKGHIKYPCSICGKVDGHKGWCLIK